MADIFTKKKGSEIMSKVKNKDSKIEMEFRKNFGVPDFVIARTQQSISANPISFCQNIRQLSLLILVFGTVAKNTDQFPQRAKSFGPRK